MGIKEYTNPLLLNKPVLAIAGIYSIALASSLALLSHYHIISLEYGLLSSTSSILLISTAASVGALLVCSIIAKKMYNEGNLEEEDKAINRSRDFLASAFVSGAVVSTILAALSSTCMIDISFGHSLSTEVSALIFAVGASITLGTAYTVASSYDDEYNNLRKGIVLGISAFATAFLATSMLTAQDFSFSVLNHLASSALISLGFGIVIGGATALVISIRDAVDKYANLVDEEGNPYNIIDDDNDTNFQATTLFPQDAYDCYYNYPAQAVPSVDDYTIIDDTPTPARQTSYFRKT